MQSSRPSMSLVDTLPHRTYSRTNLVSYGFGIFPAWWRFLNDLRIHTSACWSWKWLPPKVACTFRERGTCARSETLHISRFHCVCGRFYWRLKVQRVGGCCLVIRPIMWQRKSTLNLRMHCSFVLFHQLKPCSSSQLTWRHTETARNVITPKHSRKQFAARLAMFTSRSSFAAWHTQLYCFQLNFCSESRFQEKILISS